MAQSRVFQGLQKAINDLSKDFDALEKLSEIEANSTSGCVTLKAILLKISSWNFSELIRFLSTVPPRDSPWSNTPYIRVVRKFKKLAQYVSAGQHLYNMIRKFPNWQIQEADNGPYVEQPLGAQPDDTVGLFTRMQTKSTANQRKTFMRNLEMRIGKNRAAIEQQINVSVSQENRVHAEIQLLYHYEQDSNVKLRPRVLCSNKEACYLCYLFITTHAKFCTQRSHGNLYPQWRLPRFDELQLSKSSKREMKKIISTFNQTIEAQLLTHISQKAQRRPDPSESSVFLPGVYTPSIVSLKDRSDLVRGKEVFVGSEPESRLFSPGSSFLQPSRTNTRSAANPESVPVTEELAKPEESELSGEPEETEDSVISTPHHPVPVPQNISTSPLSSLSHQTTLRSLAHALPVLGAEPFLLSQGRAIEVKISRGSSARFYTPMLSCEFVCGDDSGETEAESVDRTAVMLRVEWLPGDCASSDIGQNQIDVITSCLGFEEVAVEGIFEKRGLIITAKRCSIMLRIVHRIT